MKLKSMLPVRRDGLFGEFKILLLPHIKGHACPPTLGVMVVTPWWSRRFAWLMTGRLRYRILQRIEQCLQYAPLFDFRSHQCVGKHDDSEYLDHRNKDVADQSSDAANTSPKTRDQTGTKPEDFRPSEAHDQYQSQHQDHCFRGDHPSHDYQITTCASRTSSMKPKPQAPVDLLGGSFPAEQYWFAHTHTNMARAEGTDFCWNDARTPMIVNALARSFVKASHPSGRTIQNLEKNCYDRFREQEGRYGFMIRTSEAWISDLTFERTLIKYVRVNSSSAQRLFVWSRDLEASRDVGVRDRDAFAMVLGWFETFRERHQLPPGREACLEFWRQRVLIKERQPWQLEQWSAAVRWSRKRLRLTRSVQIEGSR